MSEFEKELESILEKIGEYYQGITTGNVLVISKHFKDWQPPKELIKIPQYLADWFENQLKINELKKFDGNDVFRIIQDVIKVSNGESTWEDYGITDEIVKFAEDNEELFLNLIVNCSLGDGYTVEKEQLYVLMFPKKVYPYISFYDHVNEIINWTDNLDNAKRFTEREIRAIDDRYWAFAVKVEEVNP